VLHTLPVNRPNSGDVSDSISEHLILPLRDIGPLWAISHGNLTQTCTDGAVEDEHRSSSVRIRICSQNNEPFGGIATLLTMAHDNPS
jgi:hypothetical protein